MQAVQTTLPNIKFDSGGGSGGKGGWNSTTEGGLINWANGTGNWQGGLSSAIGTAGAIYGGVQGVLGGIRQGGAYGAMTSIGSAAATAAALDPEPISKSILAAVATVTSIAKAIMGDPRQNRANQITKELQQNAFLPLASEDRQQDLAGYYSGFDKYGRLVTTSGMDMPSVSDPYIKKINGNYIPFPSVVLSPYQQGNTVNINTIDGSSMTNYLTQNPNAVNAGMAAAMSVPGKASTMIAESTGTGF
jgi:hypothetical protein